MACGWRLNLTEFIQLNRDLRRGPRCAEFWVQRDAAIDEQRHGWPFLRDRRIDTYREITERLIDEPAAPRPSDDLT